MSNDNKNNDLDKFFKSRLGKLENENQDWNIPDDEVLSGAFSRMDEIQLLAKKKKRRGFLFILLIGLLCAGLISSLYINDRLSSMNQKINLLTKTLDNQKEVNAEAKNVIQNLESKLSNSNLLLQDQKSLNEIKKHEFKISQNQLINNIKTLENKLAKSYMAWNLNQNQNSSANKNKLSSDRKIILEKKETRAFDKLESLQNQLSIISFKKRDEMLDLEVFMQEVEAKQMKANLYFSFAHSFSSFEMSGMDNVTFSLRDYDKYYSGWSISMGSSLQLSDRFSLGTNTGINCVHNNSVYSGGEVFKEADEFINDSGQVIYRSDMTVHTPTGMHVNELAFEIEESGLEDQEAFSNKTTINQRLLYLSLGGLINYKIYSKGDFSVSSAIGISVNHIFSSRQNMNMSLYHDLDMMGQSTFEQNSKNQINAIHFITSIGLNAKKLMPNHLFLSAGINYSRSLNPLSTSVDQTKTYLRGLNSNITFGVLF